MEHISDIELIDLTSGHLTEDRRAATETHLSVCEDCSARRRAIAGTWQALGEWHVAAGDRDISSAVEQAVRLDRGRRLRLGRGRPVVGLVSRVAASIVVGVLIGHLAGRWSLHNAPEASASAYLSVFEPASSTGLAAPLIEMSEATEQG